MMPMPKNSLTFPERCFEPITTKEIKSNVHLFCIYTNEIGLTPLFKAVQEKTQGVALGTIYHYGQDLWLGKMGKMPIGKLDIHLRAQRLNEINQEVILEKIAYDLYCKYGHILTEITKPQREILKDLNIALPGKT